jgi:hypothetical protein
MTEPSKTNEKRQVQLKEVEAEMVAIEQIESTLKNIEQGFDKVREKLEATDSQGASVELAKVSQLIVTIENQLDTTILPLQKWLEEVKNLPAFKDEKNQSLITDQLALGRQNVEAIHSLHKTIEDLSEQVGQIRDNELGLNELQMALEQEK